MANLEIKDIKGYNCLELACRKGKKNVIGYLKSLGLQCSLPLSKCLGRDQNLEVENQITLCLFADNPDELKNLLQYVKNPNGYFVITEFYEFSLLGLAAYYLAPKCMNELIEFGCDPNLEEGDSLKPIDNVLSSIISVLPPENEEEYVEFNSGMDCLNILLMKIRDLNEYKPRLNTVFKKCSLVGKGSSGPHSDYERNIEKKSLNFRLILSKII